MSLGEHPVVPSDTNQASWSQSVDALSLQLGQLDPQQVKVWRSMSPARRLELAFQAYHFALQIVRRTERQRFPELSEDELAWRVTRRMQGNQKLGIT
jgi:hypothetical protein